MVRYVNKTHPEREKHQLAGNTFDDDILDNDDSYDTTPETSIENLSNMPMSSAEGRHAVLQLQRLYGNARTRQLLIQRRGESGTATQEGMNEEGVGETTGPEDADLSQRLDEIEQRYRAMIASARERGADVAADNLEHFLEGGGEKRTLDVTWLRGFSEITDAERINQERFEHSLNDIAAEMSDGQSRTFSDYWDRQLTASVTSELYYASGTSTIHSSGEFTLTRSGSTVTITGTVTHHWFDPYDWHAGLGAYIPGHGSISDEDALLLQRHRGAKPFEMESDWTQQVSGTYEHVDWWVDDKNYTWTGP